MSQYVMRPSTLMGVTIASVGSQMGVAGMAGAGASGETKTEAITCQAGVQGAVLALGLGNGTWV